MAKTPNAPTNMSFLSTGRKFYEATRSPTPALITTAGRFPGIVLSDSIPPSRPGTPAGTAVGTSQIDWTWLVSTDTGGSGLQGYRVYLDGATSPITTVTTNTYSSTGHLPSTNHTLRVEAFDGQGNSTQSFLGAQLTGAGSVAISWNPGFYVLAPGIGSHSTTTMDQARTANAKGWEQIVYWKTMETSRGVYDWTYTDQLLNDCKTRGLRLILQPWNNAFSGSATTALPAYLATELGGQPGYYASSDGGFAAKLWRVEIMDRFLALLQAIGARYGSDAMFEGIRNGESALPGGNTTESDWNAANYKTQYLRLIATLPTYVPTSNAWVSLNYGFPQVDFPSILAAMLAARCGLCGPDVWTGNTDHSTNGDRACRGLVWDAAANGGLGDWVAGGIDYRGQIPILHDWQGPEMGGKEGSPSLNTLYAFAVGTNKSNHACIVAKVGAASPSRAAPDDYYWDNTSSAAVADANKYTQDIKAWMATAGALIITKPTAYVSVITGAGSLAFPLASTNWIAAKGAMSLVGPRPNAETNTWARHRKAYYDGSNDIEYRVPIAVRLGVPPYRFTMISGPAGMTVGRYWGDDDYGDIVWHPQGAVSNAPVQVLVESQDLSQITASYNVTTSSSTGDFVFASTSGSDTNTGAIGSKLRSISKLLGASDPTTTYPNAIVYFDSGTYDVGGSGQINPNRNPMSWIAKDGPHTVKFRCSTGRATSAFGTNSGTHDFFWDGIDLDNQGVVSGNYRSFWAGGVSNRWTVMRSDILNPYNGSSGGDVTTGWFFDSPGTGVYRQYIHFKSCNESGRSGNGGNGYSLLATYVCQHGVIEFCDITSSCTNDIYLKASTRDFTVRYCSITNSGAAGSGAALSTGCQVDASLPNLNYEYCYNTINAPNYGGLTFNYGFFSPGQHWAYRNSIRGRIWLRGSISSATLENNAIQNSTTDGGGNAQVSTQGSPTYTNTGTECQAASGVFDTNGLLTGTYRTNYLGKRGAEIA